MLPILPALLLLLLSGASKMDRAVSVCVPGGLDALHRASTAKPAGEAARAERLWASLLALKVGPAEMDRALAALLAIGATEPPVLGLVDAADEPAVQPPADASRASKPDGWTRSCRTRDGPISR